METFELLTLGALALIGFGLLFVGLTLADICGLLRNVVDSADRLATAARNIEEAAIAVHLAVEDAEG